MELIARSFLSKLIQNQFDIEKEVQERDIRKQFDLKPYKREGKTLLYKVKDVNDKGIVYTRDLKGFYPIPNFEEKYWISKDGVIINVYTEKIIKTYIGTDLYEHVTLQFYNKAYRKRVHALMGKTFLGNPPVVNHRDGNKSNNCLDNLERSTHSENIKHAYDNGYYSTRGGKGTSITACNKDTKETYQFPSLRKAETFTGVDRHRIKLIVQNKCKNHTNWEFEIK